MSKFFTRIQASTVNVSNGNSVIYTVPADKELHVYSSWFGASCSAGNSGNASMYGTGLYYFGDIDLDVVAAVSKDQVFCSNSYPQPVVFTAGQTITINSGAVAVIAAGGIVGILWSV